MFLYLKLLDLNNRLSDLLSRVEFQNETDKREAIDLLDSFNRLPYSGDLDQEETLETIDIEDSV